MPGNAAGRFGYDLVDAAALDAGKQGVEARALILADSGGAADRFIREGVDDLPPFLGGAIAAQRDLVGDRPAILKVAAVSSVDDRPHGRWFLWRGRAGQSRAPHQHALRAAQVSAVRQDFGTADNEVALGSLGFGRLTMKGGEYPIIEQAGDRLLSIDAIGRTKAPEFATPNGMPSIVKGGIIPLIAGRDGGLTVWYDAARHKVRFLDGDTQPRRAVAGSLHAIQTEDNQLIGGWSDTGEVMEPLAGDAPVYFTKPVSFGAAIVNHVHVADGAQVRQLTAGPVEAYAPRSMLSGILRYGRGDGRVSRVRAPRSPASWAAATGMHILYGQSLAGGSLNVANNSLTPYLSEIVTDRVQMFNGGVRAGYFNSAYNAANFTSLIDAKEVLDMANALSDTGMTAYGFALSREVAMRCLIAAFGHPGTPYSGLKKGTQSWTNMLYGVSSDTNSGNRLLFGTSSATLRLDHGTGAGQSMTSNGAIAAGAHVVWATFDLETGAAAVGVDAVTANNTGTLSTPHKASLNTDIFSSSSTANWALDGRAIAGLICNRYMGGDANYARRTIILDYLANLAGIALGV